MNMNTNSFSCHWRPMTSKEKHHRVNNTCSIEQKNGSAIYDKTTQTWPRKPPGTTQTRPRKPPWAQSGKKCPKRKDHRAFLGRKNDKKWNTRNHNCQYYWQVCIFYLFHAFCLFSECLWPYLSVPEHWNRRKPESWKLLENNTKRIILACGEIRVTRTKWMKWHRLSKPIFNTTWVHFGTPKVHENDTKQSLEFVFKTCTGALIRRPETPEILSANIYIYIYIY